MTNYDDDTFNTDDKNFGFIAVNDTKYFCHFRYGLFHRVFSIFVAMRGLGFIQRYHEMDDIICQFEQQCFAGSP